MRILEPSEVPTELSEFLRTSEEPETHLCLGDHSSAIEAAEHIKALRLPVRTTLRFFQGEWFVRVFRKDRMGGVYA